MNLEGGALDLVQLPPIGVALRPPLPTEPVCLLRIGLHRRSDGLRRDPPVREAGKDLLRRPRAPGGQENWSSKISGNWLFAGDVVLLR